MIQTYFSALMEVPPRNVAETFTEAIGVLCVTFMDELDGLYDLHR